MMTVKQKIVFPNGGNRLSTAGKGIGKRWPVEEHEGSPAYLAEFLQFGGEIRPKIRFGILSDRGRRILQLIAAHPVEQAYNASYLVKVCSPPET
jgi:hypothetical protein